MPSVQHVDSRDGTPIAYRASGTGEPLLLVHGSATTSADWVFAARHLRDRFTVVTMDRRGRGRSGDAAGHSIEREAEDVAAVLEAVGGRLLVGHSYGALCCVLAAQRLPDLRRLVLYEPPIGLREDRFDGLEEMIARGDHDAVLEGFLSAAGAPEDQLRAIRSSPAWAVLLGAVPALPRELRASAAWVSPRDAIAVPTLLLLGAETDEPAYLEGLEDLAAAFQDFRQERIPGQRHIAHVFAAQAFAGIVAGFCSAHDSEAPPPAASAEQRLHEEVRE